MTNHNTQFKIGNKTIGANNKLYIIAEAGVNYENNIDIAFKMVEEAAKAGADAIKFQSYKAETLASRFSPSYWDTKKEKTRSQFELFKKYDKLDVTDYYKLSKFAKKCGITFLTTCFDLRFVEKLDRLLEAHKIASADITNYPLLKKIASKKKPVLLSTGGATIGEIDEALRFLRVNGIDKIALLHCVLHYPCVPQVSSLQSISRLKNIFPDVVIGYSDHVPPAFGILQLSAAWMLGARVVEKHFTLDKTLPGNDHYHAMDPEDLRAFKKQQQYLETLLSSKDALLASSREESARKYARRSLVANCNIKAGETITQDMLICKRPGTGISPKYYEMLVGTKSIKNIPNDTILQWDMFLTK